MSDEILKDDVGDRPGACIGQRAFLAAAKGLSIPPLLLIIIIWLLDQV